MKIFLNSKAVKVINQENMIVVLSIGMISEDGRKFYAELNDYNTVNYDKVAAKKVISNFTMTKDYYVASRTKNNPVGNNIYESYCMEFNGDTAQVHDQVRKWIAQFDSIEFWSDNNPRNTMLMKAILGYDIIKSFDIRGLYYINGTTNPSYTSDAALSLISDKCTALEDAVNTKTLFEEIINRIKEQEESIYKLWKILDDIDTASDMAKSNNEVYRNMVEHLQQTRWQVQSLTPEEIDRLYAKYHNKPKR